MNRSVLKIKIIIFEISDDFNFIFRKVEEAFNHLKD